MKLHNPGKINPWLFILLLWLFSLNSNAVVFEAENYDSFFDLSPGNSGGEFRQDDVDIESTVDEGGGFNVGWIEANEWLLFHQLVIPATGSYQINLRVASLEGASVAVDLNSGIVPLGQFTIPATGDWQIWTTVSRTVDINEGTYDLGVFAVSGGWNINFIEVIPLTTQGSSSASSQPTEPDNSLETNQSIRFEAERYVSFFDTSPSNEGRALRTDDVDIEFAADEAGAFNVGWIDVNEWLEFRPFIVPVTGNYDIRLRVASIPGGIVTLDLNAGAIPLDDFSIPVTDGWQQWTTVSKTLRLNAGTFNLRAFATTDGWNLNWIEIVANSSSSESNNDTSSSAAEASSSSESSSEASSSSESSSAENSSESSSLGETISDRSLFVHDETTFQAADFTLRSTLSQLVAQLNNVNPAQPTTDEELFARLWDTQNPAPGVITGGQKCTGQLNGFAIACRPVEGAQALDPAAFINNYRPIGLINRFDLRDKVSFSDCGEYRIIYALIGTGQRNFIIFEAQLPNPIPGRADGCLPVAQFWQGLSSEPDPQQRALQLRDFYYQGLPAENIIPVINFRNYTEGTGQIRTNQFMESVWLLKEFKVTINQEDLSTIDAVSVKSNPVDFLFDAQSTDFRAANFQADFVSNMNSLLADFDTFSLTVADDAHNNGQSHASGFLFTENIFSTPFFDSSNDSFRQEVNNKLAASGSNLTASQVIARATAMTCAGCHNPGSFGLSNPESVGPGQRWPNTLGFTHISEFAFNGVFPLSPALTDVFLPVRKNDLRQYLLNTPANIQPATMQSTIRPAATRMLRATTPKEAPVKSGKRSG